MARLTAAALLLLLAAPATPQTTRDFSGTWVLDVARSSISPAPDSPLAPETLIVTQTEKELKYERRSDGATTSQVVLLDYPQVQTGQSGAMTGIRAGWKGNSLVLTGWQETAGPRQPKEKGRPRPVPFAGPAPARPRPQPQFDTRLVPER